MADFIHKHAVVESNDNTALYYNELEHVQWASITTIYTIGMTDEATPVAIRMWQGSQMIFVWSNKLILICMINLMYVL